jgi:ArsR family transcriptional regulator
MLAKIEKIFKALADKNRLRIINMLGEKSLCVCEITEVLHLSQSTVSGHLKVLKDAGLVEDEKNGLWVEYRLCKDEKINADIVNLTREALESDPKMEADREKALCANREVICKK